MPLRAADPARRASAPRGHPTRPVPAPTTPDPRSGFPAATGAQDRAAWSRSTAGSTHPGRAVRRARRAARSRHARCAPWPGASVRTADRTAEPARNRCRPPHARPRWSGWFRQSAWPARSCAGRRTAGSRDPVFPRADRRTAEAHPRARRPALPATPGCGGFPTRRAEIPAHRPRYSRSLSARHRIPAAARVHWGRAEDNEYPPDSGDLRWSRSGHRPEVSISIRRRGSRTSRESSYPRAGPCDCRDTAPAPGRHAGDVHETRRK